MSHEIARDLSHKLQRDLGALLQRQINIASAVLEPADVSVVMLEAGVMMVRTVAATIAGMATDDAALEQLFDHTVTEISRAVASSRADSLDRARAQYKAAAA